MLHNPKTVIRSDFDQETAEKIAPQFIARLELANCSCRGSPPSCALAPPVPPVGNVGHMIFKTSKKIFLRSSFLNVAGPPADPHLGVGEDSCQVNKGGLRFLQRIQS